MPISRQARMMRTAISPRLAIRTRLNMTGAKPQLHGIVPGSRRKKGSPPAHCTEEWIVLPGRAAGRSGVTLGCDGGLYSGSVLGQGLWRLKFSLCFFFNDTATTEIYTE